MYPQRIVIEHHHFAPHLTFLLMCVLAFLLGGAIGKVVGKIIRSIRTP